MENIMNSNQISTQVTENLAQVKQLQNELYYAKYELEKSYNQKIAVHENFINTLKEKYEDIAFEIAIKENQCPKGRWGSPLDPTEVHLTSEGVVLTWEDEHPYHASSFHYFTATWEQILDYKEEVYE